MREGHHLTAGRSKLQFIEQKRPLLILFRQREEASRAPSIESSVRSLVHALELLARRGTGGAAWAVPFGEDPIAFVLDTMTDGVTLWSLAGELLYKKRAATELGATAGAHAESVEAPMELFASGGKHFARRSSRCVFQGAVYFVGSIRVVPRAPSELEQKSERENINERSHS
jgi:hypothetical protein